MTYKTFMQKFMDGSYNIVITNEYEYKVFVNKLIPLYTYEDGLVDWIEDFKNNSFHEILDIQCDTQTTDDSLLICFEPCMTQGLDVYGFEYMKARFAYELQTRDVRVTEIIKI